MNCNDVMFKNSQVEIEIINGTVYYDNGKDDPSWGVLTVVEALVIIREEVTNYLQVRIAA